MIPYQDLSRLNLKYSLFLQQIHNKLYTGVVCTQVLAVGSGIRALGGFVAPAGGITVWQGRMGSGPGGIKTRDVTEGAKRQAGAGKKHGWYVMYCSVLWCSAAELSSSTKSFLQDEEYSQNFTKYSTGKTCCTSTADVPRLISYNIPRTQFVKKLRTKRYLTHWYAATGSSSAVISSGIDTPGRC